MAAVIKNPEIPYAGRIDEGFDEGRLIRIQGFAPPDAKRFNVNLQTGPNTSPRDDTALHLSVRLVEGYVARNTYEDGTWGDEQGHGDLLIAPGQQFEIIVLCGAGDYKVAINGQHFCEFPQRIKPKRITHLLIDGDVVISLISHEGNELSSVTVSEQKGSMDAPSAPGYYGPPEGGYPSQGGYGPPQGGYGPPQSGYGAPQGGYGPPQGGYGPPQGGYGPPPGQYGPYGPPQQGYGPPPPPGQPQGQESGFENFLGTAGSVIAGAISSGMADKLISSITGGGGNQQHPQQQHPGQPYQQQYNNPPPQQQPSFNLPQFGGQGSIGGLGSVGSLLTNFASEVLQPKRDGHH